MTNTTNTPATDDGQPHGLVSHVEQWWHHLTEANKPLLEALTAEIHAIEERAKQDLAALRTDLEARVATGEKRIAELDKQLRQIAAQLAPHLAQAAHDAATAVKEAETGTGGA